jgi:hypothetical protein
MSTVKKFTTFEELKSSENKSTNPVSRLKKHNAFKKLMIDIRSAKTLQDNSEKIKRQDGGRT